MSAVRQIKPMCGIAAVAVVPAGTAAGGSPDAVAAAAVPLPVVAERSSYEETLDAADGTVRVRHRLTVAVPEEYARANLDERTLRLWAAAGTAAVIDTLSGERLVAGWSERFGSEQPLRLTAVAMSTGTTPHESPAALLTFGSVDTSPAAEVQ